ncbi:MAG: CvpA family protein [Bacilli bacterium]
MNLDYEALMSYFNYSIIAILVLGVIFGFFKGTFKSVYNLIVFVVLLLIGWFLSPVFSNMIINYDLSSFNLEFGGVTLTSLGEFVLNFAGGSVEGLEGAMVEGTLFYELVNSFMVMVVRIVFIIVWLILMATVFKFIFWIIYLIIKPKKIVDGKKKKKTLTSRLGGMGVSLVHALITVLLISIPLAGFASIGASISTLAPMETADTEELGYTVVYTNNGVLLANGDDLLGDAVLFMENYRDTLAGKISGFVKLGDSYFDEAIFDEIFSIKVAETKIKIRAELQTAVNVYSRITEELGDEEFSIDNIIKIDTEVLDEVIDDISKLKLIHIAIPVGLEVAVNSDILDEQLGEISALIDLEDLLEELKEVDYEEEISYLGKALVAALVLMQDLETEDGEEPNYLGLDPDKVEAVTDQLSESEILRILSDVAMTYLINSEGINDFLVENGMEADDINLDGVTINNELKSISNIYRALHNAGFNSLDFASLDLSAVTDDNVNEIADAIYSSTFFSNNTTLLAAFLFKALPEEYQDVITINNFNRQDFISILSLGVVMANSGMLGDDFDPIDLLTEENIEKIADYISKSDLLSENVAGLLEMLLSGMDLPIEIELPDDLTWKGAEGKAELVALFTTASKIVPMMDNENGFDFSGDSIDELADTVVESRIIMHNMSSLISFILDSTAVADEIDPETLEFDWDSEEGKAEFKALLTAISVILDSGLIDDPDFANLSDGTIDPEDNIIHDLATAMSESTIIKRNLTPIISGFLPGDFEIDLFEDPDDWTYEELNALFRSAKILLGYGDGFDIDTILELTEAEIDIIVSSRLIVNTAVNMLEDFTKDEDDTPAGSLNGVLFLPSVIKNENGYFGIDGELKKFILAAQIVISENTGPDEGFESLSTISLTSISGENQATILDSEILIETIISNIENISEDSDLIELHPDFDRSSPSYVEETWETELPLLIDGILVFLGEDGNIDDIEFDTNLLLNITDQEIDTVTASRILSHTIVSYIEDEASNEDSLISLPDDLNPEHANYDNDLWYGEDGELVKALKALRGLGISDFEADISLDVVYDEARGNPEDEVILASRVIEYTIINKIETEATTGALVDVLIIPDDVVWEVTYLGEDVVDKGELRKLINAIEVILDGDDFENADFDVTKFFGPDQPTLLASMVVEASVVNKIEAEMEVGGSLEGKLVKPGGFVEEDWYGEDGELVKFLNAIEVILGGEDFENADFDVNKFFGPDQPTLLASRVVEASVVNTIETEMAAGGSLEGKLVKPDGFADEDWYGEDGELVNFLNAIEVILGGEDFENADFDVNKFFGPDQETLLASRVVEASVVNTIETEMAAGGSLENKLVTPDGFGTEDWYGEDGELVKFLNAIEIILGGDDFENADFDVTKFFGPDQETLLASRVVEASVVNTIETEMATGGSLENKLVTPDGFGTEDWYGEDGELVKFLSAIEIILDGDDFENATFDVNKFFGPDQETLLASRVVEASVVNTIEIEMEVGGSLHDKLVKPAGFTDEDWYGENGELVKFLASIEKIIGPNDLSTATFDVDTILGEDQEVILDSRVVEASVIKHIVDEPKINTPTDSSTYYYLTDGPIVWERSFSGETVTDEGELRRFLTGISELIGPNDFASYTFTMDNMLETNFEEVLKSRVLEATIADTISELVGVGGVLDGFILEPASHGGYQWFYHQTSVNPVRNGTYQIEEGNIQKSDLEGFLIAIQAMDDAGVNFNTINLNTIKNSSSSEELASALWDHSRVLNGSIETMLNKVLDEASVPENPPFGFRFGSEPGQYSIETKQDVIDGINMIKMIP